MRKPILGFVFLLIAPARVMADDAGLILADLEAYRQALSAMPDRSAPLVRFRDLWDHPEAHAGRPVRVEGRVARLFRQPRIGEFPPLVEAWLVSAAGDPFCLVCPQQEEGRAMPEVGALVQFSGTFLKRIKYHGGDTDRLAPLIVGPSAPSTPVVASEIESRPWSSLDWMMAVGASMVVALVLASRHFARPEPVAPAIDPPPPFIDGGPGSDSVEDEEGNVHEVA